MNATSAMFAALALVGCATDEAAMPATTDGTYDLTRTVTQWEPSPDFAIPTTMTLTIANGSITGVTAIDLVFDHGHVTFTASEDWPSPEGTGAANLAYDLQLGDGTLAGTITARVIFDQPPTYGDFDFGLSISGAKRP